ncbi:SRPBCC family protein [Chitinophaga japonensis]|uniref:Uncharacterized protein YndB with AHSA1/START domain n=1 Tax=Chitinophaga japonensis TaxID=104662 RepID=A0A562SZA7_CHIJA|nr:SRPBCC domain-containing protein [Chitinophaga japonensis]TWI86483.1 uncharacterized protein YndB with AHSA1/START domain [Chitinophaga japonensis]
MAKHDWSRFSLRIPIKAGVQDIYDAWTVPANIEKWFLRQALFSTADGAARDSTLPVQQGDTYLWRWHGYPDDVNEHGAVLAANGKDFLQFTFGIAGTVSVTIKTVEGESLAELVQDKIPTDEESKFKFHIGCQGGWLFYLVNLKSLLEGGIDLRNRNEQLTAVINS